MSQSTNRLIQTWRWYGEEDTVSLQDVKQAGASGVVSALHHIPHGDVWSKEEILKRKLQIEKAGLTWEVVESVNVHEDIKTRTGNYISYIEKYKETLRNLSSCGIHKVCYNFMPVLDWTRTQLDFEVEDGSKALRFDWTELAIFDVFILKRKDAVSDYDESTLKKAEAQYKNYLSDDIQKLSENILMGVPGENAATKEGLLQSIAVYKNIGRSGLRENLAFFLEKIMDTCEEYDIKMTIHPDDPPMQILGLPRIVSTMEDLKWILQKVDRQPNGICYCTGSLGAGKQNDLVHILKEIGNRVYFAHLRNVTKEFDSSFFEANHLGGDNDMALIMKTLLEIQNNKNIAIPYRPDHGHQMLDDLNKVTNPGYSAIGRLRGLAELRGLEVGISGIN